MNIINLTDFMLFLIYWRENVFLAKSTDKKIYTHTITITLIEYMILEKLMATCLLFSPHSVENINFVFIEIFILG